MVSLLNLTLQYIKVPDKVGFEDNYVIIFLFLNKYICCDLFWNCHDETMYVLMISKW